MGRRDQRPSHNFIYDFEFFRSFVLDEWREVFSQDGRGDVVSGSVEELTDAFARGAEVKVGLSGLCDDLVPETSETVRHEVFIQVGSCYYYTDRKLFVGATHPLVRVRPKVPMRYTSEGWDFGWAMARTDGFVALLLTDPYTLRTRRSGANLASRWFVRG